MGENAKIPNMYETSNSLYGGTVYTRYFFGEGSKAFRPFLGFNVSALPGTSKATTLTNPSVSNSTDLFLFGTNVNAGFGYALSQKVAVVGSLGVLGFTTLSETAQNGDKTTTNSFGFDANSLGNRFNIGIYYTFFNR